MLVQFFENLHYSIISLHNDMEFYEIISESTSKSKIELLK
jgi:hypothetical protein